jgi:hypothetical protein
MENIANSVVLQKPDYSTHNLTEECKTTSHLGRLTPVYFQEVIPGDSVDISADFLTKFQPMLTPAFQNLNAYIHYFYVPFRILWPNWKYFIQNVKVPDTSLPPVHPFVNLSTLPTQYFSKPAYASNLPYFGLNSATNLQQVNPFPMAAYALIYNEYFRHQKVTADNVNDIILNDGDNSSKIAELASLRYRTYKGDYFTAALPSPQNGNEAAFTLATASMLPVYSNQANAGDVLQIPSINNVTQGATVDLELFAQPTTDPLIGGLDLYVDPSAAGFQISMNDLIEVSRMQEFLVRQNLAGNRYNEYILAFFGIRVPDLRIDRPDYICGVKAPVTIAEVLNTANAQGTQSGQANSYAEGGTKNYKVLEHGIIIGIYSCIPEQSYMQATNKLLWKSQWDEYYVPIFDQMGERAILNKELVQTHTDPDGTFGYIPQYAEYRLTFNKVSGEFTSSLYSWHLASALPNNIQLGEGFFNIFNPSRVFGYDYTVADPILVWISHNVYMTRPMKKYAMPTLTNNYGNNLS